MSEEEKDFMSLLNEMIDEVFKEKMDDHFDGKKPEIFYESIEDYTRATGKRFRINKDQKERGLSRDEAFRELFPEKPND
tara:strand:- start:1653 stop:1889 length:237 start_codon:yes stop_codon:yes gene_type:complete